MRTAFPSEGSETHLRDTAEPSHNTVAPLCTAVSRCGKNQQKTWLQTGRNHLWLWCSGSTAAALKRGTWGVGNEGGKFWSRHHLSKVGLEFQCHDGGLFYIKERVLCCAFTSSVGGM